MPGRNGCTCTAAREEPRADRAQKGILPMRRHRFKTAKTAETAVHLDPDDGDTMPDTDAPSPEGEQNGCGDGDGCGRR
ncbi:hypothetical protein NKH77_40505 [Streptomyces sp. M19]